METLFQDAKGMSNGPKPSTPSTQLTTFSSTCSQRALSGVTKYQMSDFDIDDGGVTDSQLISVADFTPLTPPDLIRGARWSKSTVAAIHGNDSETDDDSDGTWFDDVEWIADSVTFAEATKTLSNPVTSNIASYDEGGEDYGTLPSTSLDFAALEQQAIHQSHIANAQSFSNLVVRGSFLDLPAELRLIIYGFAAQDTNPATRGAEMVAALPCRLAYTYRPEEFWKAMDKPCINLAPLMRTCWQIYREARDDFLYKDRQFGAIPSRMDRSLLDATPSLTFWPYIQHLSLLVKHRSAFKTLEVRKGIEYISASLNFGRRLRSLKLVADLAHHDDIMYFADIRVHGPILITQRFTDDTYAGGREMLDERERRLQMLMLRMRGLPYTKVPVFDTVVSHAQTSADVIYGSWRMHIAIDSDGREDLSALGARKGAEA